MTANPRSHPFPVRLAARRRIALCASVAALSLTVAAPAQERAPARTPTPLLTAPLMDAPGKNLVVVDLNFAPNATPSTLDHHGRGHHHPGSVYVYVTQGTVRLAVEGQPVQIVPTGGSFFEAVGAHHIIAESASATEPAHAIAVMIVPEGAPLVTPDKE
jgi:quercetin dioxygenase-like cupin family protein